MLFGRSIAARLPDDLSPDLALMVMDVCGAPALVARVVGEYVARGVAPTVAVLGGAGKSGSLSLAAARDAGAGRCIGVVPVEREADLLAAERAGRRGRHRRRPLAAGPLGCRGGGRRAGRRHRRLRRRARAASSRRILATAQGGTVIFFSMATSFSAAALGAEGLAADVRMLVGNGYVPGHADLALDLLRRTPAVRALFEARLAE